MGLGLITLTLAGVVATQAPQLFSPSNVAQVTALGSIVAVAAVGQTLVLLTRNVDLSVESVVGLVAFAVADVLARRLVDIPIAVVFGLLIGLCLGMVNGALVVLFRVPAIVATLGTMSAYRGFVFLLAGGKQVTLTDLPSGYTDLARITVLGAPLFLGVTVVLIAATSFVLRYTHFGRQVYAVGSNPEAAAILGIRSGRVTFVVFAACGLMAGLAGILWGMEFGTINASSATGLTLQVVAAAVVGGVNILGGSGSAVGAGLGALFLALLSNALILLRLSQFWLQAIYGVVILMAVTIDVALTRRARGAMGRRRGAGRSH
jgi:rhamnose transport system permease protein